MATIWKTRGPVNETDRSTWCTYDIHPLVNQVSSETQVHVERTTSDDYYQAWGWTAGMWYLYQSPASAYGWFNYDFYHLH